MIRRKTVIFSILFLLSVPCYGSAPGLIPVSNYSERITGSGLSILPPQDKDWYVVTNNPNGGVMFSKEIDGDPFHTIVCSFVVVPIQKNYRNRNDFLDDVKKMQENYTDKRRFKDVNPIYNLNERFGSLAVEYKINVTDMKRKKKGHPLVLKMYGYSFVHPKNSAYMVDINYSERSIDEDFTASLFTIGKEFIDNLIIE